MPPILPGKQLRTITGEDLARQARHGVARQATFGRSWGAVFSSHPRCSWVSISPGMTQDSFKNIYTLLAIAALACLYPYGALSGYWGMEGDNQEFFDWELRILVNHAQQKKIEWPVSFWGQQRSTCRSFPKFSSRSSSWGRREGQFCWFEWSSCMKRRKCLKGDGLARVLRPGRYSGDWRCQGQSSA